MSNVEAWTGSRLHWFDAPDYEFARQVLQRGVAALYFVAFLSTLNQFPALLGERGLLPVPDYLEGFSRLQAAHAVPLALLGPAAARGLRDGAGHLRRPGCRPSAARARHGCP